MLSISAIKSFNFCLTSVSQYIFDLDLVDYGKHLYQRLQFPSIFTQMLNSKNSSNLVNILYRTPVPSAKFDLIANSSIWTSGLDFYV